MGKFAEREKNIFGLNPAGPTVHRGVRVAAHIGLRPWRGGPSGALEMARLDEAHARVNVWRQRALVVLLVQERSREVAR